MAMTSAAYLQLLQALMPPGRAWSRDPDSVMAKTLSALSQEFARVDERSDRIIEEADPRFVEELLPDFEALYEIVPPAGASLEERRAAVLFRFLEEGDIKKPFFISLAAAMGYTIRIDDYTPTQAGWIYAGDELIEEPWEYFTAGIGMAGGTLAAEEVVTPWIWEVVVTSAPALAPTPSLEDLLNDLRPAHIQVNFTYL